MSISRRAANPTLAIAAGAAVCMFVSGCGRHGADVTEHGGQPVAVTAVTLEEQSIPSQSWASGTIEPIQKAGLAPKIMSTVTGVYVREGDRVRKGQVLVRLESKDLTAQLASARAATSSAESMKRKASASVDLQSAETKANIASAETALAVAREQLSLAREGSRKQERTQAQLGIARAEAQFKNAQTDLSRARELYDQGAVAKQSLDSAQTRFDVAKAELDIARQQSSIAEEGTRAQDIRSAEQRVRQAEEALRLARASVIQNRIARNQAEATSAAASQARAGQASAAAMLGYATITAPFAGVVTSKMVDKGDLVSPGTPVVSIQDDSLFRLEATAAQSDSKYLTVGRSVTLQLGAKRTPARGRISVVSPAGDPTTRKFLVKVDIPKGISVNGGDFGRMSVAVGESEGIAIPEKALKKVGGIPSVFVIGEDNKAKMRIVRTGRSLPEAIEITSGLKPGDRLIVDSEAPLRDDAPVAVKGS